MSKNTSVLLGDHFDEFISQKISSGSYNSASDVIQTALRILEEEEAKKEILINALIHGENSPRVKNFDPKEQLKKLHERVK